MLTSDSFLAHTTEWHEEVLKCSNRDHITIPGRLVIFQLFLPYMYYLEQNLNNNACEE
jgi:hypothetical protein